MKLLVSYEMSATVTYIIISSSSARVYYWMQSNVEPNESSQTNLQTSYNKTNEKY
jgi:hypothetical protein